MSDLRILDQLEQEFARVAAADDLAHTRRGTGKRRRGRRGRGFLLALPIALTLGGGAFAASRLLIGEPIRDRGGVAYQPDVGAGAPKPVNGSEVAPVRAADPAGGPPWAVRVLSTTRDNGCVQIGRMVDGQFGVLGQDGTMHDDGKFHAWPANVVALMNCRPHDGAGHTFLAVSYTGLPASGAASDCTPTRKLRSIEKFRPAPTGLPPACPDRDLRNVRYGALGPQGKSVTYRGDDGRPHTVAAAPGTGAYVIVTRPDSRHPARGQFVSTTTPLSGLISVQYHDGTVCRITNPAKRGGATACPAVGYVPLPRTPSIAASATPLRLTESPTLVRPGPATGPRGVKLPPQRKLTLTFPAPVATKSYSTYAYDLRILPGSINACRMSGLGGTSLKDVTRGQIVHAAFYLPAWCNPSVRVTVRYHVSKPDDPGPNEARRPNEDRLIGRVTKTLRVVQGVKPPPSMIP